MEDRLYTYTNDVTMLPLKYNFPEINVGIISQWIWDTFNKTFNKSRRAGLLDLILYSHGNGHRFLLTHWTLKYTF